MFSRSSKSIVCLLVISVFLLLSAASLFAAESRCTLVKVSAKGQRLSDIVSCDASEMLVIQLLNNIQNPYDLKEGMKIMVPDKAFVKKVKDLPAAELKKEVSDYRGSVSEKMLKEVDESVRGVEAPDTADADGKSYNKNASSASMKQMQGQKPEEIERMYFPRRPRQ